MQEFHETWENGRDCVIEALNAVNDRNSNGNRNKKGAIDAINRQSARYASHPVQVVLLVKMMYLRDWVSSSNSKGEWETFYKVEFGS